MSLNVEAMTELIAELRSGNWTQGAHALRFSPGDGKPDQFCCLGIACEIAVKHGKIDPPVKGKTSYDAGRYYYGGSGAVMPPEVSDWFGFSPDTDTDSMKGNPVYGGFHFAGENDRGTPFSVIADHFELMLESDQSVLPKR